MWLASSIRRLYSMSEMQQILCHVADAMASVIRRLRLSPLLVRVRLHVSVVQVAFASVTIRVSNLMSLFCQIYLWAVWVDLSF